MLFSSSNTHENTVYHFPDHCIEFPRMMKKIENEKKEKACVKTSLSLSSKSSTSCLVLLEDNLNVKT